MVGVALVLFSGNFFISEHFFSSVNFFFPCTDCAESLRFLFDWYRFSSSFLLEMDLIEPLVPYFVVCF